MADGAFLRPVGGNMPFWAANSLRGIFAQNLSMWLKLCGAVAIFFLGVQTRGAGGGRPQYRAAGPQLQANGLPLTEGCSRLPCR